MSSSFKVTLDTTAPALSVVGDRDPGDQNLLVLTVGFGDAEEMRVWGDIDPLGVENGNYALDEESAPWFTPESPLLVRVPADNPEPKLFFAARDDVWNLATLDRTFPIGGPPQEPTLPPSGGMPRRRREVKPRPSDRSLSRATVLRVRSSHSVSTSRSISRRGIALSSRHELRRGALPSSLRSARQMPLRINRRGADLSASHARGSAVQIGRRGEVVARTESTDETDAMIALDFLS